MTGPLDEARARAVEAARRAPWLVAVAGYSAAYAIATWPLVTRMGSATYGGPGDGWALIWQTWSRERDGLSYFSSPVDSGLAWPFGADVPTAALLSNVSTEWPTVALMRFGASDVLAYNLVLMGAAVASSLAMYAVIRRLGARPAVAFWAGLVYMVAPWVLDRIAIHLTLSLLVAFPLLILGVVEWARGPSPRAGALVVGATALAVYTHGYYGFAAAVILVACLPIVLLTVAHRPRKTRALLPLGTLAASLVAVAAPLAIALSIQSEGISQQLDRSLYLDDLALDPQLLVLPSVENPVFGDGVRRVVGDAVTSQNTGELALYLGWMTLILAGVGIWAAITRRTARLPVAVAAVVGALGLLFALPATVDLPLIGHVSMPVSYAHEAVTFISTPARFFVLLLTGVIVVGALGLEVLVSGRSRRTGRLIVVAAMAVSLVELPVWVDDRVVDTSPPAVAASISRLVPEGEPIVQYPSVDRGLRPVADQLFWQRVHGHPLANGAISGSPEDVVRQSFADPTRAGTPGELALLGIRWATYEPAQLKFVPVAEYRELPAAPPGFLTVERFRDGSMLMRVTAAPAPGIVALGDGFEDDGGGAGWRWISGSRARLLVCATTPGPHRLRLRARGFAAPRTVHIDGTRIDAPVGGEGAERQVPVRLDPGWQWITIRLAGSSPVRPVDVDPSSTDGRALAFEITPPELIGPRSGDPGVCRARPPR